MKYSIPVKFLAIILCAATLLGTLGSGLALFALTETGAYSKGYDKVAEEYLESRVVSFAQAVGGRYASEYLGGASPSLTEDYYATHYWNNLFNQNRMNYTIKNADGEIVHQLQNIDAGEVAHTFQVPITCRYMNVINTMSQEEYRQRHPDPEPTTPVSDAQILVMPQPDRVSVGSVTLDYLDGHQTFYDLAPNPGFLYFQNDGTLAFKTTMFDEASVGAFWNINHIQMRNPDGDVVYEAYGDSGLVTGTSQAGNIFEMYLPAGEMTQSVPAETTVTDEACVITDAIPPQGCTVSQLNVTYGKPGEAAMGSEGVGADIIGTIYHVDEGVVQFRSLHPMTMDLPEGTVITHITFSDATGNALYEATDPEGVGTLTCDEYGFLVYQPRTSGEAIPEATVPQPIGVPQKEVTVYSTTSTDSRICGTIPAGEEVPILQEMPITSDGETHSWGLTESGWILMDDVITARDWSAPAETTSAAITAVAQSNLQVYSVPNDSNPLGTIKAGETVAILQQEDVEGVLWGLTESGWIPMDQVVLAASEEETVPQETMVFMSDSEPEAIPETSEGETVPETTETETVPQETAVFLPDSEVETIQEAGEPTPDVAAVAPENLETWYYYDPNTDMYMAAEITLSPVPDYTMEVELASDAADSMWQWTLLRMAYAVKRHLLPMLGICAALCVICTVYLCCAAGRKKGADVVRAGGMNRIPLDLYLGADALLITGLAAAAWGCLNYLTQNSPEMALLSVLILGYVACLLVVGFCYAFVAQIKTPGGFWYRNTFCGWCIRLLNQFLAWSVGAVARCWRGLRGNVIPVGKRSCRTLWAWARAIALWMWDTARRLTLWAFDLLRRCIRRCGGLLNGFFSMLPITWQFLSTGFILVFLLYVMMRTYKVGYILLGFGIFFAVILYAASAFAILLESAKRMSKGDLDTKVDDRMLIGGFREFAHRLNDLAGVAVIAAQKQLKSERMKTELITNVSHDIKTPLTSIINYVDLLQKPHSEAQQAQYLEVLDRQSQRLKKLIDDLMEMSKASTGNLPVDIVKVDAVEAVNQALGEFADKLERAQLTPVFRQPDDPVAMMADGRLVWRVMSNLLGNAVKYALPGTRIYLDLMEMDGKVIISMKNISREELNVNAEELMERFVRGDASRNTEGSGLGLNIAQSLMELQRGQLQILVDGDLFKVTLIFPGA
ncbi:MAG: histidine kinase dimerization/phospho-acceptor domain-containing protein [Faecousia sp.]